MKNFYLVATIIGTIVPYIFFVDFFVEEGINLMTFIPALFANGAAGGFTADLLVTSVVFWIFLYREGVSRLWLYVLLNMAIGLSCALPLYLYHRERAKDLQSPQQCQ